MHTYTVNAYSSKLTTSQWKTCPLKHIHGSFIFCSTGGIHFDWLWLALRDDEKSPAIRYWEAWFQCLGTPGNFAILSIFGTVSFFKEGSAGTDEMTKTRQQGFQADTSE